MTWKVSKQFLNNLQSNIRSKIFITGIVNYHLWIKTILSFTFKDRKILESQNGKGRSLGEEE